MNTSIVRQLVRKDLLIMKKPAIWYWIGGVASILLAVFFGDISGLVAMILFIATLFGVGIHCAMQTVVQERKDQTLAFVMSLPITAREFTSAKLIANLVLVGGIWLTLSAASYMIFIGESMPNGAVPFVTIVLIAIFLAYVIVLATVLIFESEAAAITAIVAANLCTQAVLWWVSDLHGIRSVMGGNVIVWNATEVTVIAIQAALTVGLIAITYLLQARKVDFV